VRVLKHQLEFSIKKALVLFVISVSACQLNTNSPELVSSAELENWYGGRQFATPLFSLKGNIVSAVVGDSNKYRLYLWQTADGKEIPLPAKKPNVIVGFDNDGKIWAVYTDGGISVITITNGVVQEVYKLRPLEKEETFNLFVRNNQVWAVFYPSIYSLALKRIQLWNVSENKQLLSFDLTKGEQDENITQVSLSPDAQWLAIGSGLNQLYNDVPSQRRFKIEIFRVSDGKMVQRLGGHSQSVLSLCFSPDSQILASGGGEGDGKLKIWRVNDGRLMLEIVTQKSSSTFGLWSDWPQVRAISFSQDGKKIAFGGGEHVVYVANVEDGKVLKKLFGHKDIIIGTAFNQEKNQIISIDSTGTLNHWKNE